MFWNVWNSIAENTERSLFAERFTENEQILEVCGVDSKDHLFIERTAAISHQEETRKFMLTAAVVQDGIVLIRQVHSVWPEDLRGESSLFQTCKVEKREALRIVHARLFEPLPSWPRYKHSYALK